MPKKKTLKGYKEAESLDRQINILLTNYPVEPDSALEWLKVTRTVSTTLDIIGQLALEQAKEGLHRRMSLNLKEEPIPHDIPTRPMATSPEKEKAKRTVKDPKVKGKAKIAKAVKKVAAKKKPKTRPDWGLT